MKINNTITTIQQVNILNKTNTTITIEIVDSNQISHTLDYKIIQASELNKDKPIELSKCYIDHFVLDSIENTKLICTNCFFDNATKITKSNFYEEVNFENSIFYGNINLHTTTFHQNVNFSNCFFHAECNVANVTFEDSVDYSFCSFIDDFKMRHVEFQNNVMFFDSHFKGNSSFKLCTFNKVFLSSMAHFFEPIKFSNCSFNWNAIFEDASFLSKLTLSYCTFNNKISFNNSSFHAKPSIISTTFNELMTCKQSIFKDGCEFYKTKFNCEVSFHKAHMKPDFTFSRCEFNDYQITFEEITILETCTGFVFSDVFFGASNKNRFRFSSTQTNPMEIHFERSEISSYFIFHNIQLSKFTCINSIISGIFNFSDSVDIQEIALNKTISKGIIQANTKKILNAIHCDSNTNNYEIMANTCLVFKENSKCRGDFQSEDLFYVHYKRYDRKSYSKGKKFISWMLDAIGEYGTNPLRVALSMFVIVIFFALLYILAGNMYISILLQENTNYFLQMFYYSIITFLTVGYGEILPLNTLSEVFACMEAFCGVFLMSYFSVAVVRKTLR